MRNQNKIDSLESDAPVPGASKQSFEARSEQAFTPGFESVSLSTLQNQNRLMEAVVQRNNVLLRLGRSLSSAESPKEAADVIVQAASDLFNWDACSLSLYLPEENAVDQLYIADTFNGKRTEIKAPPYLQPSPLYGKILTIGAELILRTPEEVISPPTVSFGNTARRSASLMFVPLRQGERGVGVLTFQSYSFNAYTEDDLQTLQSLADHCGGTLRRLRADQERKRIEERNLVLLQLGKNLSSARSPRDAAEMIISGAAQLFAWDASTIDLYLPEQDLVVPLLVVDTLNGEKQIVANGPTLPPSTLARRVLQNGSELILRTFEQLQETDGIRFGNSQLSASIMYVSILHAEKIIGLLSFQSYTRNAYDLNDLRVLQMVGDYCGGALERIRIETHLRSSQVRFHSVWESSVDGMRLTDPNGIIVAVNQAYCLLVGMSREELEGKPFTVVYGDCGKGLEKYKSRFKERFVERQVTRSIKFRSGTAMELEATGSFIESESGETLLLALFRDVTAHKLLEEELRQSHKMESVGQLAGGIAHDFNNILTVIGGHASLLLMNDDLGPDARDSIDQIATSSERAASLTRQLLAFSRKQVMQARPLDLNDVVQNMTRILQRVLGEHICLKVGLGTKIPPFLADAGMVEQVLLNLAVNARDAMPNGGTLIIETAAEQVDNSYPEKSSVQLGTFVCLKVGDTGCGIPPDVLPRIFEPFFTTKDVGKGTGLGLATVYGIVKQHGGFVRVQSVVNEGTSFQVYFPQSSAPPSTKEPIAPATDPGGGKETILVVEDEEGVRSLASSMLKRLGYRCLEATSGVHALKIWEDFGNEIDLVLTDVVMPEGISGWELAQRLRQSRPDTRIIFSSGYPRETVGESARFEANFNFLQKPYHPKALARMVRDILDQ